MAKKSAPIVRTNTHIPLYKHDEFGPHVFFAHEGTYGKSDVKVGKTVRLASDDERVLVTKRNGESYEVLVRTSLQVEPFQEDAEGRVPEDQVNNPLRVNERSIRDAINTGVYRVVSRRGRVAEAENTAREWVLRLDGTEDPFLVSLDANVEDLVIAAQKAVDETDRYYVRGLSGKAEEFADKIVEKTGVSKHLLEGLLFGRIGYSLVYTGEKTAPSTVPVVLRNKKTAALRETLVAEVDSLPGTVIADEVVQPEPTIFAHYERRRKIDIVRTLDDLIRLRADLDKAYADVASSVASHQDYIAKGNIFHLHTGSLARAAAEAEAAVAAYGQARKDAYRTLAGEVIETVDQGKVADPMEWRGEKNKGKIDARDLILFLVPDADDL